MNYRLVLSPPFPRQTQTLKQKHLSHFLGKELLERNYTNAASMLLKEKLTFLCRILGYLVFLQRLVKK